MVEYLSFENYCKQAGIPESSADAKAAYRGYLLRVDMWNHAHPEQQQQKQEQQQAN